MQGSNNRGSRKLGYLPCILSFFVFVVSAGATVALADDPTIQPPSPPTPVEMQEGLNADNSAIYDAELTDPQAAEELPHQDLDREQALELMQAVFDPLLQAPAGIFDELDVQRFLSNNAAIVAPGDQPESTGATIGAPPEDRYEGTTLLESTTPLRTDSGPGPSEAVDLGLEHAEGEVQPSNPLVEVSIPQQLGEGIELPEAGIQVHLDGAPSDRTPTTVAESVAAYPEVATDTSFGVAPTPGGFETLTLLQSADAPTSQTFELDLPNGASLRSTEEGGAEVVHNGQLLMGVSAPTALDAAGEDVPVTMTVAGDTLTLEVSPGPSASWPILLDPLYETYNWWNGITGLGGWSGWTNAAPNYYRADHATCTSYASPFACQSGLTSNAPGLYIGALPGAVPANSTVNWEFVVPRWAEEWTNYGRAPTSFISNLLFRNVGYWHRTDSSPNPTLWMGIWNTVTPGWVAGASVSGNYPDINGTREAEFGAGQSTSGKIASFSMGNPDGHNLSAFRDAFVNTAIVTIADADTPNLDPAIGPSKWVNQVPTEPITVTARDLGLGVYRLKAAPENVPLSSPWPTQTRNCTGTTVYPCTGAAIFTLTRHGEGSGEVRDYDPSVMPQGVDNVLLTAEDPLGNKSETKAVKVWVDHSAPVIAPLSGTLTEQAKLGTNASQYTLKYSATDGDNATQEALAPFGPAGSGQPLDPQGMAVDNEGNVWVVDRANSRVQKFDKDGNFLMQFGSAGPGNGQFNEPRGIDVSDNGTVWVSEIGNKRVQAFTSTGQFIRKITYGSFSEPWGVATGPGGVVWVADVAAKKVFEFREAEGAFLGTAYGSTQSPTGNSDLSGPVGLDTDADGSVWVVDNLANRIVKFNSSGKFVLQFGSGGTGNGQLQGPVGVAIARSGHVLVADGNNNRIQVFQPNGVYLRQFGATGSGNAQLSKPRGLGISSSNTLFIADGWNHRIARWNHADLDRQSGVVSTEVKVDGNLVEPKHSPGCATENCSIMNREWTLPAKNYASGTHTVQVTATDGVGLPTTKPLTITTVKDTTAPQLTANSAFFTAPEGWLEQKSYVALASATDSGGYGVTSMVLKIDGKIVQNLTQGCQNGGCGGTLFASINMATYKGGAHPAELVATDVAGNTAKKAWTINVDPKGSISGAEAIDTLKASDETAEKTIVASTDEVISQGEQASGNDPSIEQEGETLIVTGVPTETEFPTDPTAPITIPTPDGSIQVDPLGTLGGSSPTVANEAAIVTPNTNPNVDTVVRPIYDGFLAFANIRDSTAPETYSWRVIMGKGQSLEQINEQTAAVIYAEDGTSAATIKAELAHDATGKELPTSLKVEGSDIVTLTVHHKTANVTYPVVGGPGFEVGYESVRIYDPPEGGGGGEGEEELPFDGVKLFVSAPQYAPHGEDGATASSAAPPYKTYRAMDCENDQVLPVIGCGAWQQSIKGFFWYNGNQAWWKDEQNPPKCPGDGMPLLVEPNPFYCDFVGPNHQPYGNGQHITSQVWYEVEYLKIAYSPEKAITVRMFGSGGVYGHNNGCVCNPSVAGQNEGPSY